METDTRPLVEANGSAGAARYELRLGGDSADDQHEETFEVELDGEWRELRSHDYDVIFSHPGLYEQLFHVELDCRSPEAVTRVLRSVFSERPGHAPPRILDVGAGNGMVAEQLATLEPEYIVGLDILPEAAEAAWRDRPDLYSAYHVMDLTDMTDPSWHALEDDHFDCMTTVAALGFADIPPPAFVNAFNLVADGGLIAFNLKDAFLDGEDDTGFARLIRHMFDEGVLVLSGQEHYRHRLSVAGEPLHYVAFVGEKHCPVPPDWDLE
ncbi:hypothetical protein BH24ACT23_BH24ACT23_11140 [soil metagenome]